MKSNSKFTALLLLVVAEVAAMSLWFVSSAVLPEMLKEAALSPFSQAALSSSVQAGFVVGALASAVLGISDRFDPRRVFAASAAGAGLLNCLLVLLPPGHALSIAARAGTGALLAGVYPVGMKIAVGWGDKDRGFLVGVLVGALTLGSASPHLLAMAGGGNWRATVLLTSAAAVVAGALVLLVRLGPHHAASARFDPRAVTLAWTNRRVRWAYAGYLGHMWELFAMWAWCGVIAAESYKHALAGSDADWLAKLTAFCVIAIGAVTCAVAGVFADRIGKAEITIIAMIASGAAALATAATFGGPPWLTFCLMLVWGAAVIPDSAQFSALVADASPPEQAGSLLTFQTALGFALTFATVQLTPALASALGWPAVIAGMAIGPAFGIWAMSKLVRPAQTFRG